MHLIAKVFAFFIYTCTALYFVDWKIFCYCFMQLLYTSACLWLSCMIKKQDNQLWVNYWRIPFSLFYYFVWTFFLLAIRLDEDRLCSSSPVLARLFLQSIFISVDVKIREGHLFCDCLCDNGPLHSGQVSTGCFVEIFYWLPIIAVIIISVPWHYRWPVFRNVSVFFSPFKLLAG